MNMDIEAFLVSSTVVCVLAQRLLRKVCDKCAVTYQLTPEDLHRLEYTPGDVAKYQFSKGKGTKDISFEAQVIGLIDSYEPLKYSDKLFRKALKPYDALQIIKEDVLKGRYNKQIFIDLCSCLIK
jgi:type II secretory ATPase GspE/PulE/Tfp pilus assembly ATPase PilB-like protein